MERQDFRQYIRGVSGPRIETELTGTSREVDLIIRGLKSLRAMLQLRDAAGISPERFPLGMDQGLVMRFVPREDELDQLIQDIEDPHYVDSADS